MATLPPDIHPESLNRLPPVKREDLDPVTQRAFDRVVDPNGGTLAGLRGPAGISFHSPKIATPQRELNRILRTQLDGRLTELAILVTARELDHQFEWTIHEPAALKEGLEPHIIDLVRHRRPVAGLPEKETLIIEYGRELLGHKSVQPETFANVLRVFGREGIVNLTNLMATYVATGVILNAFDQQLWPGWEPLLPPRT